MASVTWVAPAGLAHASASAKTPGTSDEAPCATEVFDRAGQMAATLVHCDDVLLGRLHGEAAGVVVRSVTGALGGTVGFCHADVTGLNALFRNETVFCMPADGGRDEFGLTQFGALSGASVPVITGRGSWGFIAACSTAPRAFSQRDLAILRALASTVTLSLTLSLDEAGEAAPRSDELRHMQRAKGEWEATVDALHEVIFLLDSDANVVRANRALEGWGFGRVAEVVGAHVGSVLVGVCRDGSLERPEVWAGLLALAGDGQVLEWEQVCATTQRTLRFRIRRIIRADGQRPVPGEGAAALIVEDVTERKRLEQSILEQNHRLEQAIASRTGELAASNRELRREAREHLSDKRALMESERGLRDLSARLIGAQERERQRIASELHDSIGQSLSAIKFKVEGFMRKSGVNPVDPNARDLNDAMERVRATLDEVRKISMALRPSILDDLGLISTMEWFSREFREMHPRTHLQLRIDALESDIPNPLKLQIYRIAQEAFNNIVKHAEPRFVSLAVGCNERGVRLCISDDGSGFDPDRSGGASGIPSGLGLKTMRERAELSGGEFCLGSAPGFGSWVAVFWPVGSAMPLPG